MFQTFKVQKQLLVKFYDHVRSPLRNFVLEGMKTCQQICQNKQQKCPMIDKRGTKRVASNSAVVPQVRLQTSNSGKNLLLLEPMSTASITVGPEPAGGDTTLDL